MGECVPLFGMDMADDLTQETLLRAWNKLNSFCEGTNLMGWLYTILRNAYYAEYHKRRRDSLETNRIPARAFTYSPHQAIYMDLLDLCAVLHRLPKKQSEALVLVGGLGFSHEEAALICNCDMGTLKSRVSRARNRLYEFLR